MRALLKSEKWVSMFCRALLFISLFIITILAFSQVFLRVVANVNVSWIDETCRYLQILMTYVGSGYIILSGGHMSVDLIRGSVPPRVGTAMDGFSAALGVVFAGVLTYYGFRLAMGQMAQKTAATGIPIGVIYMILPLGGILIVYYSVIRFIRFFYHAQDADKAQKES